jgi:GAF domain-containing protein
MMPPTEKERLLVDAFATVTSSLVRDHDVLGLLQTLVEIAKDVTGASEVGLLLVDETGHLEVVTSTRENGDLIETMEHGADAGPCHQSFVTGQIVADADIAASRPAWSQFRDAALALGLRAVISVPMRYRDSRIGVLSIYHERVGSDESTFIALQSLADAATISILHERLARDADAVKQQLEITLNSRLVIEQAKGVLAQLHGTSPEHAFTLLRDHARTHHLTLNDVATGLVNRTISF